MNSVPRMPVTQRAELFAETADRKGLSDAIDTTGLRRGDKLCVISTTNPPAAAPLYAPTFRDGLPTG